MSLVEGYFDESGDIQVKPHIFCVAGYFIESEAAKAMSAAWSKALAEYEVPYFHMVDCAHEPGRRSFKGVPNGVRSEVVRRLIDIIKEYTSEGFAAIVDYEHFSPSAEDPDGYGECVNGAVAAIQSFMSIERIEGEVALFFETGHKSRGRAYSRIADRWGELAGSLTFKKKTELPLLQAADLLAWQVRKYVQDRLSGARAPRSDFLSLMEHPHTFFYHTDIDGRRGMAVEAWPLSRRHTSDTKWEFRFGGPISLVLEEGEGRPIVPIHATIGYRLGGGRLAYVAFRDQGRKEFALAFDDRRLFEALEQFVHAAALWGDSPHAPVILAESVTVMERTDKLLKFAVSLGDGLRLIFEVPTDAVSLDRPVE